VSGVGLSLPRSQCKRPATGRVSTSEAAPRTAEVVVGLAGDVAVGWGQADGLS